MTPGEYADLASVFIKYKSPPKDDGKKPIGRNGR